MVSFEQTKEVEVGDFPYNQGNVWDKQLLKKKKENKEVI